MKPIRPDFNYQKWSDSFDEMDQPSIAHSDENEESAQAHLFMAQLARHLAPQPGTIPGLEAAVLLRIKAERRKKEWRMALLISSITGFIFLSALLLSGNINPLEWISNLVVTSGHNVSGVLTSFLNNIATFVSFARRFYPAFEDMRHVLLSNIWPLLFIAPLCATGAAYLTFRTSSQALRHA